MRLWRNNVGERQSKIKTDSPETPEQLKERARRLQSLLGIGIAVFLTPAYLFLTFYVLRWLQPRALGTYAFLVGGPIVLAVLTARFSSRQLFKSFALMTGALLVLSLALYASELEAGICLVVLLLPFVVLGGLVSIALNSRRLLRVTEELNKSRTLISLLLFVPALALVENGTAETASSGELTSSVVVAADAATIWEGIVEVDHFSADEIPRTWLSELGVPRPVRAKLERIGRENVRVGYFEGGLRFLERFKTFRPPHELSLAVQPDESSLPDENAIQHAFSQGYLEIDEVRYRVVPTPTGARLSLSCRYTVHTTVTPYAHWVAHGVIERFERQLLHALRARFEGKVTGEAMGEAAQADAGRP